MDKSEQLKNGLGFSVYEAIALGVISVFVVLFCNDKLQRRRFEKLAANMKGPPGYPILGNGLEFIGSSEQILNAVIKLFREYGSEPCRAWLGSTFVVTIVKPDDIQIILNSPKALEKAAFYNLFKFIIGEGLFTASTDKWQINHRLIAPVFKLNRKEFLDVFNDKNKILVKKLDSEINKTQPFDLWKYIVPIHLSMTCQNAMDYDLDIQSDESNDFIDAITNITGWEAIRVAKPWLYSDIIYSIYLKLTGRAKFYKIFRNLPKKVIQEKKNKHVHRIETKQPNIDNATDDKGRSNKSFVTKLLELNESGANFSEKNVEDEVITFMIGGTETTAVSVCGCLLLLAMHQHIQDKVYDEIYEVFGDSDEVVTIDDTYKLVYLDQVLKETLRIYPTAPMFFRKTQDDVKLMSGNHILPKGTTCLLSPFITHHLSEIYPDPWTFNPENFSAENIAKRHKYSFIPFSGGLRGCVGSQYALLSMKVQVSTILRKYSVHTSKNMDDVRLEFKMTLRHANGYPVTIQPRNRTPTHKKDHTN